VSPKLQRGFDLRKSERGFRLAVGVLAILIVTGLTIAAVIALRISAVSLKFDEPSNDNASWRLAQLEVDYLQFVAELGTHHHLNTVSVSGVEWTRIVERFDIFYARVATVAGLLEDQSWPDPKHADTVGATTELFALRDRLALQLDRMDITDPNLIDELSHTAERIRPLVEEVGMRGLAIIRQSATRTEADFAKLVSLGRLALIAFVSLLVSIIAYLAYFYRRMMKQAFLIEASESTLRKVVVAMPDAIIVYDLAGRILDMNAAAEEMFGSDMASAYGKDIFNFSMGQQRLNRWLRLTESANSFALIDLIVGRRVQMTGKHANGRGKRIEVTSAQGSGPSGPFGIALLRDVTDRVRDERNLRRLYKKAAGLAKSKDRFLSVMSHEMRTPLHGVIAALDLVDSHSLLATDAGLIRIAQTSARTAITQIEDVLDAARLRNGAAAEAPSSFLPSVVVDGVIHEHFLLAQNRGTTIHFDTTMLDKCDAIGLVRTFRRAVSNLLSNACKFTLNGKITVRLSNNAPDSLRIEVKDTGVGIPATHINNVFDEFFSLDEVGWNGSGGAGLGLPIFATAVTSMQGKYGLSSIYGAGSLFWFEIPYCQAELSPLLDIREPVVAASLSVLVVDDSEINRVLLARMVERLGHVPTIAIDGPVAVEMAQQKRFDLILIDIRMPGMDGFEVARQIGSQGLSCDAVMIGVTAHIMRTQSERTAALSAGLEDVLIKPVTIRDLSVVVARTLHLPALRLPEVVGRATLVVLDPERWSDLAELGQDGWIDQQIKNHFRGVSVLCDQIAVMAPNKIDTQLAEVAHVAAGAAAIMGLMRQHAALAGLEDRLRDAGLSDPADEADSQRAIADQAEAAVSTAQVS